MKKIMMALLAVSCFGMFAGSALANQSCYPVSVVVTGTTPYTASGLYVKVKNESGAACGSLANGANMTYYLSTTNTDATYATVLTALSLQKKLNIQVSGTGAANSLVLVCGLVN